MKLTLLLVGSIAVLGQSSSIAAQPSQLQTTQTSRDCSPNVANVQGSVTIQLSPGACASGVDKAQLEATLNRALAAQLARLKAADANTLSQISAIVSAVMQTETAKLGRGQAEALQTLQAAVLNAIERLSAKLDARENNDLREAPAAPALDLEVDVPNLPQLWRTNQADAVQLIPFGTPDRSVEAIATVKLATQDPRNVPHNLWLILFPNVTIWNKSERRRVSLQFEFRTTIKGPRPRMEIAGNITAMAASELQAMSRLAQIPMTLEEHGPGRAASQVPGVLSADQAQLPFLRGPLAIDALTHAQGVLAFFYQQLDQQEAPVGLFKGTLIIKDRLSGRSMSIDLEKLIERVKSKE